MEKEHLINGCFAVVERIAGEKGLTIEKNGDGIVATGKGFSVRFRTLVGEHVMPELVITRPISKGEEMIVINFSDRVKNPDTDCYDSTGEFEVHQVRIDGPHDDYMKTLLEVHALIDDIRAASEDKVTKAEAEARCHALVNEGIRVARTYDPDVDRFTAAVTYDKPGKKWTYINACGEHRSAFIVDEKQRKPNEE